jgi:hypothetical protein
VSVGADKGEHDRRGRLYIYAIGCVHLCACLIAKVFPIMSPKLLALVAALTLAGAAQAITVNMTDFNFGTPINAVITGSSGSPSYDGAAGAFAGTLTDTPASDAKHSSITAASSTSFVAWCAELTQSFSFGTPYDYTLVGGTGYFGAQRATDLSRLFTAASQNGFIIDATTSAAFQAGIWEIIYEQNAGYSFLTGTLHGAPEDPLNQAAFDTVNGFLVNLGQYAAGYQIDVLTNGAQQDFLIASIPEPETWALLVAGLGVIGSLRRRRKA